MIAELQIGDAAGVVGVGDGVHAPDAIQIAPAVGDGAGGVERRMVVHGHLRRSCSARDIGKVKTRAPLRILAQVDAADQQVVIDDLEDVVEALPRRIEIAQQDVLAGLQRAVVAVLRCRSLPGCCARGCGRRYRW